MPSLWAASVLWREHQPLWSESILSIVFGLGFATVLTLIVTPCALMLKANIHKWRQHRSRLGADKTVTA